MNVGPTRNTRDKIRTPRIGYNHNFRHHGRVFHVQTEDAGTRSPHIDTHVFCAGTVVASTRTDYDPTTVRGDQEIIALMQMSHKDMCSALAKGTLDERIATLCGARVAPEPVERPELDPSTTLEILSMLDGLEGFQGAAIVDQEAKLAVHSISLAYDLDAAAATSADMLHALHRTLEGLQLGTGVEDILTTTQDRLLILRPVSHRYFVYVITDRTQTNLGLARHLVASAAKAIRAEE